MEAHTVLEESATWGPCSATAGCTASSPTNSMVTSTGCTTNQAVSLVAPCRWRNTRGALRTVHHNKLLDVDTLWRG